MANVDETGAQRVALGTAPNGGAVTPVSAAAPLPVSLASGGQMAALQANNADGVAASGTADKQSVIAYNYQFNGTTWDRIRGDASGIFVNSAVFWTEASANQAAAATLNGTLRANGGIAAGAGTRFEWFVAEAFADVAGGTLYIDKSIDGGTTWRQVGSIALVAGTSVSLRVPITAASYRARHVNGANATTAFLLTSGYQT